MASDYGLNFGFRRSDESVRVSEGRFKTPADGPVLLQGTCVTIDSDGNPGYLKAADAGAAPLTGVTGLLVQEEVWDRSFYEHEVVDSFSLGVTKKNRLSVITNGPGVKVWFRNTPEQSRADGREIPAVEIVDLDGVDLKSQLGWNGTTWVAAGDGDGEGGGAVAAHMTVTYLDVDKGYVEAVLIA